MYYLLSAPSFLTLVSLVCSRDVLDLSYVYSNDTEIPPGNDKVWPFVLETVHHGRWAAANNIWYEMYNFRMSEHAGTHLDAPSHFAEGKWAVHQIPLANLIRRPAVVVDISEKSAQDPNSQITVGDLDKWEKENGPIPAKSIVLMYSGWGKYYGMPMYNNFIGGKRNCPSFSPETCRFLVNERDIVGVGVDTGSVDGGGVVDYPAHVILQSANMFNIENGANFDKLPSSGALVTMMPLSIEGGSGSPARMYAEFPGECGCSSSGFSSSFKASSLWAFMALISAAAWM